MSRAKGDKAEERASVYLNDIGFRIVGRNVSSRFGEIDILAIKDDVLHIVEVKSGVDYESAIQNITKEKMRKIYQTAQVYIKQHNLDLDYCFDVVIVTGSECEIVENVSFY